MLRDIGVGLVVVIGLGAVWGVGYNMGCSHVLEKVRSYYSSYRSANSVEGQALIRFLEK